MIRGCSHLKLKQAIVALVLLATQIAKWKGNSHRYEWHAHVRFDQTEHKAFVPFFAVLQSHFIKVPKIDEYSTLIQSYEQVESDA